MRLHFALTLILASAVIGCSAIEPNGKKKNKVDAPGPETKEKVIEKEPVTLTAIELKLQSLTDIDFPLPDHKITESSTDGEFYYFFGDGEGSKYDRFGKPVSSFAISKELQAEFPSDQEICYPFAKDHSWVVSANDLGIVRGTDPTKFTDNRETVFSTLPKLQADTKRIQMGISSTYVLFVEGGELSEYSFADGTFATVTIALPALDAGETIVGAGKNNGALWVATSSRLWALIADTWQNRPLKVSGLDKITHLSIAFTGATLDKWEVSSASLINETSVYILQSDVDKISQIANNANPTDGQKYSWASNVRLLSDLYCVQCHTWAEKEVEWIKRLSDIQSRVPASAITEVKTMPQLNSVPAGKITLQERAVIIKWLDQQKAPKP